MTEGYHTMAIMLDKNKAFDLVPHELILQNYSTTESKVKNYYGLRIT